MKLTSRENSTLPPDKNIVYFQGRCCFPPLTSRWSCCQEDGDCDAHTQKSDSQGGTCWGEESGPCFPLYFHFHHPECMFGQRGGEPRQVKLWLMHVQELGIDPTTDERTERRHKVHRWTARWRRRLAPSEVADWRKQGEGVLLYKHPARERERERVRLSGVVWLCSAVHCGSALRCSGVAMVTSSPTISLGSNRIQISLLLPLL